MEIPASYQEYTAQVDAIGEIILQWSDPDKLYRGYTEVR
jgi:hypothetical protein